MPRIGLVGCVKTKQRDAAPARNLYASSLFQGRRTYVEKTCDEWFILSAKHGLIHPDELLEPYEQTLEDASALERRDWAADVVTSLRTRLGDLTGTTFEIHAGNAYANYGLVEGILSLGGAVERPTEGLGLGQQLAFYNSHSNHPPAGRLRRPVRAATIGSMKGRAQGKYAALRDHLIASGTPVKLSLETVARLVGGLPMSAWNHRGWWANDATHAQARAWLDADTRVVAVDLREGFVKFQKA